MDTDHALSGPDTSTLLERMTRVLSEQNARDRIESDRVQVDGEIITDSARPTPPGHR